MKQRSPSDLIRSLLAPMCDREVLVVARQAEVKPDRLLALLEGAELSTPEMQRLGAALLTGRMFLKVA